MNKTLYTITLILLTALFFISLWILYPVLIGTNTGGEICEPLNNILNIKDWYNSFYENTACRFTSKGYFVFYISYGFLYSIFYISFIYFIKKVVTKKSSYLNFYIWLCLYLCYSFLLITMGSSHFFPAVIGAFIPLSPLLLFNIVLALAKKKQTH